MTKYRILRKMPLVEVGEIVELDNRKKLKMFLKNIEIDRCEYINGLIHNKWIEEVKEEKLEGKRLVLSVQNIKTLILEMAVGHYTYHITESDAQSFAELFVGISKDHFLDVFDKAVEEWNQEKINVFDVFDTIRKTLENC